MSPAICKAIGYTSNLVPVTKAFALQHRGARQDQRAQNSFNSITSVLSNLRKSSYVCMIQDVFMTLIISHNVRSRTSLPNLTVIGQLYLKYCDCQPLPLFDPSNFIESLDSRDSEVILCIQALALRFSKLESTINSQAVLQNATDNTKRSRSLVMNRIAEGRVELSTLQSLCLLSLLDLAGMISQFVVCNHSLFNKSRWQNYASWRQHKSGSISRQ